MKLSSLFMVTGLVLASLSSQATIWTMENCRGQIQPFIKDKGTALVGTYLVSLSFSDVTGAGSGFVRLNYRVKGQPSLATKVPLSCHFQLKPGFGVGRVQPGKPPIVCESTKPIVAGMKIGFPFFQNGFGLPSDLNSYVQLEDGNYGHGTILVQNCTRQFGTNE